MIFSLTCAAYSGANGVAVLEQVPSLNLPSQVFWKISPQETLKAMSPQAPSTENIR